MKSAHSSRGRSTPSDIDNVTPFPSHSPSPCVVDDVEELLLCTVADNLHLQQQHHQQNVYEYLRLEWSVTKPERYEREAAKLTGQSVAFSALNDAANELHDELARSDGNWIKNRGAWAVTTIRRCVADIKARQESDQQIPTIHTRAVGDS